MCYNKDVTHVEHPFLVCVAGACRLHRDPDLGVLPSLSFHDISDAHSALDFVEEVPLDLDRPQAIRNIVNDPAKASLDPIERLVLLIVAVPSVWGAIFGAQVPLRL